MGQISQILQRRSPVVHIATPEQVVSEAISVMATLQIGVLPIVADGELVGIFSERDLVRRVIAMGRAPDKTPLGEVMTPNPVTAAPDEERLTAITKMQTVGCRHLPVVAAGAIIDMLSMRDLLFVELEERQEEVNSLRRYIGGSY
jgi:CBS domain-containing protein